MKLIRKQEREFFSMPRDKSRENLNAKNEFIIDFGGQNDIENNKILITLEKTPENKREKTQLNDNLKTKYQTNNNKQIIQHGETKMNVVNKKNDKKPLNYFEMNSILTVLNLCLRSSFLRCFVVAE